MMPLSEENILLGLIQQQRLKVISASQQQLRLSTEIQSLAQLKSRSEGFLNAYDQLFRYISIWLLIRGYDLTNNQPHQVLKAVCILNCSNWEIDKIIYQRHQLKKKLSTLVNQATYLELQYCLQYFQKSLQAYVCMNHQQLKTQ